MTLQEVISKLQKILNEHPEAGHLEVYFDTEARTFEYHMAKVGHVFYEPSVSMVYFLEERP